MRELLRGFIDLHLHAVPSVADREVDAADMALTDAAEYGYRAFVVKDHLFPTMMPARIAERHIAKGGLHVFGGIVLNNSVGLFNLKAVDVACEMGAKFICLPTVSAANHIEEHRKSGGHFPGAGKSSAVGEVGATCLDVGGDLVPGCRAIIDYVAAHPGPILMTGHGNLAEVDAIVHYAAEKGVKKIYVNHPYYLINADIGRMVKWVELGAYIEFNACLIVPESTIYATDFKIVAAMLENLPAERLVIVSDLGQKGNIRPAAGVLRLIEMLMHTGGVTEDHINLMGKRNPAKLLELD